MTGSDKDDEKGRGRDLAFGAGATAAVAGGMAAHEAVSGTPAEALEDPGFGSGAAPVDAAVDLDGLDGPALAETGELGRDASFDLADDGLLDTGLDDDLPGLDDDPGMGDPGMGDDLAALGAADDLDLDDPADADLDDLDFG